jgi:hypothetical protein
LLRVVCGEGVSLSNEDIREGVRGFGLLGRFQKVEEGGRVWYLDGAHNEMAMPVAANWFAKCVRDGGRYVVFFGFSYFPFSLSAVSPYSNPYHLPSTSTNSSSPSPDPPNPSPSSSTTPPPKTDSLYSCN